MTQECIPFEAGSDLYRAEPELLLIEVWHRAPSAWSDKERADFVMAYIIMRRQKDSYQQEKS